MYYYIFDVKKFKKRSQVENIKEYLGSLGITGEYTYPSSAQSVEELTQLGISKQYTTIVAVGSDEIANEVAKKLVGKKEAMGIIPIEASPELGALIGADNWKEACEILRFRKISEIRLGKTATGNHFLTSARLEIKTPIEITIELKDCMVQTRARSLVIANFSPGLKKIKPDYLDIMLSSVAEPEGVLSKISSMFGLSKSENKLDNSLFRARSLRIFTKMQVPIISHDQIIAKTPQYIESTDENLRLITAKKASCIWEN